MAEMNDDDILAELGVDMIPKKVRQRTAREERIIAGFEDITKFCDEHGRAPQHGEDRDIFERLYAVRLDRLREQADCQDLLVELDRHGLLKRESASENWAADEMDDDLLLAELNIDANSPEDITQLRYVRSDTDRAAAEEIANSKRCDDFAAFKPLLDRVQADLAAGVRTTRPFVRDLGMSKAEISTGEFFIVGGQIAYVAAVGALIKAPNGENDARLRVIYSNGTESDLLLRSLQRSLYRDEGGRRVSEPNVGPLFSSKPLQALSEQDEPDHVLISTLYVLRSRSTHPTITANRELIHKIGVTGQSIESRIANARNDPTFLLADVEVVATYTLLDVNRSKLEALIHRVLRKVQFDTEILDRFGKAVRPQEWFLVPISIVDEIVRRIEDRSIVGMVYDPVKALLVGPES